MLLYLLLACREPEPINIEVCEEEISVTDMAKGLTDEQKEVSYIIEQEFSEMDIPPNITAAAIVNAIAESKLNPDAIGDGGKAVGAFQLHKSGLGKNLSVSERTNVYTSANIIGIQILKNNHLYELENNNSSISDISKMIAEDIMRPDNIEKQKELRNNLAKQIFPERIW
jgi:hypothetical protein